MIAMLLVAACFALSGACGLVYENVWIKQTTAIFGSTILATTVVLAAFMGGLAIGSWCAGWLRVRRPLRAYGWLELGITGAAMLFPVGLSGLRALYPALVRAGLGRGRLAMAELVGVGLLVVLPTALMGATLPVLMRFAHGWIRQSGRALGVLYAVNTAGAVFGSLLAGFRLIPDLGLSGTARFAWSVNAAVGIVALATSIVMDEEEDDAADEPLPDLEPAARTATSPVSSRLVFLHVFVCGFAAMLYEVALMKLLPLILGSSTYSFSLMVAAFITGIALGSATIGTWVGGARRPVGILAWTLIAQGIAFLVSIPLYSRLPELYLQLRIDTRMPFGVFQAASFGLCFLVMVVPTFFLGGVLPVAAELTARAGSLLDDIGRLYAANTAGNIAGTVATGLFLVPHYGFKACMELGIALNLASGLRLLFAEPGVAPRERRLVAGAVGAAALLYVIAYPRLDLATLNVGVFRLGRGTMRDALAQIQRTKVLFAAEDETGFVTVTMTGVNYTLRVNGKPDASTNNDMLTQKMLAHWPLLVRPDAKRVLVIGLGSGITAGTALLHPVKSLECVEISPRVVEAARWFGKWNHDVLADPRLSLALDDGRNHLERSNARFDVIISEPSNPWIAGVGSLFTVECFRAAQRHLAPGGVVAQWMHAYEMDGDTYRTVLRTFRAVFPHVTLMQSMHTDLVMLGSMEPLDLNAEVIAERMKDPRVAADLASMNLTSPLALAALQLVPDGAVEGEMGPGPLNTDDRPVLEYAAPLALYSGVLTQLDEVGFLDAPRHMLRRAVSRRPPDAAQVVRMAVGAAPSWPARALATVFEEAFEGPPRDASAEINQASYRKQAGHHHLAAAHARRAAQVLPENEHVLEALVGCEYQLETGVSSFDRDWSAPRTAAAAGAWLARRPRQPVAEGMLGMVRFRERRWPDASALLSGALEGERGIADAPAIDLPLIAVHRALACLLSGDFATARADESAMPREIADRVPFPLSERLQELVWRRETKGEVR